MKPTIPAKSAVSTKPHDNTFPIPEANSGLSIREYLAAQIMAGCAGMYPTPPGYIQGMAEQAVYAADCLITALNMEPEELHQKFL